MIGPLLFAGLAVAVMALFILFGCAAESDR